MTDSTGGNDSLGYFTKRVAVVAVITLATLATAVFLQQVGEGLLIIFAAILLAVLLDGAARLLTRFLRLRRIWALPLAIVLIVSLLGGGFALGGAGIASQGPQLKQAIQKEFHTLQKKLHAKGLYPSQWVGSGESGSGSSTASSLGKSLVSHFGELVSVPLTIATDLVVIVVVGVYFAANPQFYLRVVARLFPPGKQERILEVAAVLGNALRRWFVGRLLAMLVVGVLVTIGLALFGVKLAFLLGFIAGIFTFVPYLGAVISAIPAVLVGLLQGPLTAVFVIILFLGAHIIEGYVLIPLIQERQVQMAPGYLVVSQFLGGLAAGALGILLATPFIVALTIMVQMFYLQDVLHEKIRVLGNRKSS